MAKCKTESVKDFRKQFKKPSVKDGELVLGIIKRLADGEILEAKYKDHKLKGEM